MRLRHDQPLRASERIGTAGVTFAGAVRLLERRVRCLSVPLAGNPDVDAVFDEIVGQVIAIRGLKPATVERETIDAEALKKLNAESFDKDNPPEYVAGQERLYKSLGLIPEDVSLREVFLDLVDSQVAGFYRPDAKKLYVVSRSGAVNGADKITFAHEYDHALQDANFPVFEEQKQLLDQSDRAMARASIYEGDATLLMAQWAVPNSTPAELQDVVAAGSDPESMAILERTPAILSESLLFPYNTGVALLSPIQASGGWEAIDAIYKDLPASTEQIIHPEKFAAREAPVEVTLPADLAAKLGAGWTQQIQDTFGEFQMRTWLGESGADQAAATKAAGGWGGDRVAVLVGPGDAWAMVMKTAWDTKGDAGEFATAATAALERAGGSGQVLPGEGGTTRWVVIGSDDATLGSVANALGLAG